MNQIFKIGESVEFRRTLEANPEVWHDGVIDSFYDSFSYRCLPIETYDFSGEWLTGERELCIVVKTNINEQGVYHLMFRKDTPLGTAMTDDIRHKEAKTP